MALQKTASGKVDKRTKEGKAIAERMAKARAAAAKKTAAAKKITEVKKATGVKKTTIATKPVAKKSNEISVNGNKKIDTLRKEFNKQFPYLRLGLYYSYMRNEKTKTPLSGDKTLASVRRADSGGDISIAGNKKIKTLEQEFDKKATDTILLAVMMTKRYQLSMQNVKRKAVRREYINNL